MSTRTRQDLVGTVRSLIDGSVLTAGDPGYETARTPFFSHRIGTPVAVVRPRHAVDVATTVRVASRTGTSLFVRSGGHSWHSTGDGILLDLGTLNGLDLDLATGTAWAEAGLTAGAVSRALAPHDMAVGFGDTGSVGIGGISIGGGIGFLSRLYGLTVDNVLAAEIVTADGRVRVVDADHEPDLFWAIRGGGGNFGIVTRFRYRLAHACATPTPSGERMRFVRCALSPLRSPICCNRCRTPRSSTRKPPTAAPARPSRRCSSTGSTPRSLPPCSRTWVARVPG
jgi:FAD/FMN-containing dehydrogenase